MFESTFAQKHVRAMQHFRETTNEGECEERLSLAETTKRGWGNRLMLSKLYVSSPSAQRRRLARCDDRSTFAQKHVQSNLLSNIAGVPARSGAGSTG